MAHKQTAITASRRRRQWRALPILMNAFRRFEWTMKRPTTKGVQAIAESSRQV
jgi:hypothetical protein